MRELIEFLAKSLVDHPDEVKTRSYERAQETVIELEVAAADLGQVIGRQFQVSDDGHEWIVDLVSDAGRQLADGHEAALTAAEHVLV